MLKGLTDLAQSIFTCRVSQSRSDCICRPVPVITNPFVRVWIKATYTQDYTLHVIMHTKCLYAAAAPEDRGRGRPRNSAGHPLSLGLAEKFTLCVDPSHRRRYQRNQLFV